MPADSAAVLDDEVLYDVSEHIATITLNRPDRMNTISGTMLAQLTELLLKADRDPDVRAIILTGKGRAFCAGLDLRGASQGKLGLEGSSTSTNLDLRATPPTVLFNLDTPTICALNGSAAGYGLDTALGCDMRLIAEGAKLAVAFTKRAIVPESGGTWLLPRLVGWSMAAELIFTGRTLSSDEAVSLGLASRAVPEGDLQAEARKLAAEIAANAPLAVQAAKRMMRMGLSEGFNEHVHHVFLQLMPLIRTEDFGEAVKAFQEKRAPDFKGR
ncbi:enoyl-CoA hydratase/isomerase family protein [Phenylobacterium kunshanense]|uniref:Enoyl-CoA hydratase/isomerase family protein n=1 Tax=Phenylobacterium kunshanense TaxID=1445034 RepID=A0A328B5E4_9CAUL|nr:enoyl-CoA hydratase-related protein [Phenylobacterium kunshanense]RAK62107.1 enoyl-CoA hydratase/isomerase family protein [Phenylobacterium kunshanense]